MNTHSRYLADFNVAGMRYWDGALVLSKLEPGEKLQLIAEPQNLNDSDAVAIYYKSNKIGYIPQDFNFSLHSFCVLGIRMFLSVAS